MPPATKIRQEFVQAREPATGTVDGEEFVVNPREIFSIDHPIVRAHPNLFKPVDESRQRPVVEQMTVAPGERRGQ